MIALQRFKYHCKNLLVIFFVSLVFFTARSQQPYFKQIATNRDLNGYQINCIYQDQTGFIWVGTSGGIFRFDGNDFDEIVLPDSIENKNVTAIFEDEKAIIWFGFENGNILQFDRFRLTSFNPEGFATSSRIQEIIKSPDQSLWIGTYGDGLFHYRNGTFAILNSNSGLSDDYIYCLLQDKSGNVWAGTDNGINICNLRNEEVANQHLSVDDGLPDFIVTALVEDKEGNIWIGMFDKGFCFYDTQKEEFISPLKPGSWKYGSVTDIIMIEEDIWLSTDGHGIVIYDTEKQQMEVYENSNDVNLSRIRSMLYDLEGNIWLISNHSIQAFRWVLKLNFLDNVENYPLTNIHAIIADSEDNLWFVNDVGLHTYNPNEPVKEDQLKLYLLDIDPDKYKVMSLYRDAYGFIWAGTFGKGVLRFDPKTGNQIIFDENDGLVNGNVLSIKGSETEIWFATLGGVSKCSINNRLADLKFTPEFTNYGSNEGLVNNFIYNLFIDSTNRVWLATDGSGVSYFEENRFVNISNDPAFNEKVIYSIAVDERKNVWMNAAREGLFKYDGESISHFTSDKEHKNLSFTGILANKNDEPYCIR
ncbi:MAG: two-component regulator propeller domain-containing protein [Bacteroidales bacterium]